MRNQTPTMMSKETAMKVVEANIKSDPEWSYQVLSMGNKYSIVVVFDEDGNKLGVL